MKINFVYAKIIVNLLFNIRMYIHATALHKNVICHFPIKTKKLSFFLF